MSLHPNRNTYQPISSSSTSNLTAPSPSSERRSGHPEQQYYDDEPEAYNDESKLLAPSPDQSRLDLAAGDGWTKQEASSTVDLQDSAGHTTSQNPSRFRRNVLWGAITVGFLLLVVWLFGRLSGSNYLHSPSTSAEPSLGLLNGGGGHLPIYSEVPHKSDDPYPVKAGPTAAVVESFAGLVGAFPPAGPGTFGARPTQAAGTGSANGVGQGALATPGMMSNGTHDFERMVMVVSFGGFAAEWLDRGYSKNIRKGLVARYLQPVFPTLKYPNHWSLLTGLYPESHGIVGNEFMDSATKTTFNSSDGGVGALSSWDPSWWLGEPIWATAQKSGILTGSLHWPGPHTLADGTRPQYWYPEAPRFNHHRKLNRIAAWLDSPISARPRLMTIYMPEIDYQARRTSPKSRTLNKAIGMMDSFVGSIQALVEERNLTQIVDLIFVSDHGLAGVDDRKVVYLDRILGKDWDKVEHWDGRPDAGLWFKDGTDVAELVDRLEKIAVGGEGGNGGGFEVYTHEDMPQRWHFSDSTRIPPVYIVPKAGYTLSTSHEHLEVMSGRYTSRALPGYDPASAEMRGIFVAQGPFAQSVVGRRQARRARLRRSIPLGRAPSAHQHGHLAARATERAPAADVETMEGFENVQLYTLLASLLGIEKDQWAKTNGTDGFWDQYLGEAPAAAQTEVPAAAATDNTETLEEVDVTPVEGAAVEGAGKAEETTVAVEGGEADGSSNVGGSDGGDQPA